MQVKCDYCGSWMEDSDEKCPNCSAANTNLVRVVKKTPTTIAELIDWYKARNLPPFETTRFFIGENYKGAKAFGIYEDAGEFVVYKNKADGSRAVRYRGKDEAYAVNEIYLRLKEEILNQKNVSQAKKAGTRSTVYSAGNGAEASSKTGSTIKGIGKGCLGLFLLPIAILVFAYFAATIEDHFDAKNARPGAYYISNDKEVIYYYNGKDTVAVGNEIRTVNTEWWFCDADELNWSLYNVATDKHNFPSNLGPENLCGTKGEFNELLDAVGAERTAENIGSNSPYEVTRSKQYKDVHHYLPSASAYYVVNGQPYYYLYDNHSSYSDHDNHTGWYIYEDGGWDYYCSADDHETLGDDLWYYEEKYNYGDYDNYQAYVAGSVYNFSNSEAAAWDSSAMASDFSDTVWYMDKEENDAAYDRYWAEQQSSSSSNSSSSSSSSDWSSDSDWDWDSSDSWDSGSTDWDSDW